MGGDTKILKYSLDIYMIMREMGLGCSTNRGRKGYGKVLDYVSDLRLMGWGYVCISVCWGCGGWVQDTSDVALQGGVGALLAAGSDDSEGTSRASCCVDRGVVGDGWRAVGVQGRSGPLRRRYKRALV